MSEADQDGFTAVSLFSGAGGMDVGFEKAGFNVIFANDIDPNACATYRANHPGDIHEGSLTGIDVRQLVSNPDVDLVFGGPPCQGFSVAGKMDPEDERSKLIHTFFDTVDQLLPRAFVCENVKALAVLNKWAPVRESILIQARKNYHVAMVVLNAVDFGVPQIRERVFIIGIRHDVLDSTDADLQALIERQLASYHQKPVSVGDIVRSLGRAGSKTNSRVCAAKITFARSPVMRATAYAGMIFNGAGRPLPAKKWATTLPASMGGNRTPIVDEAEIFDSKPSFVEAYHAGLVKGKKPSTGNVPKSLRRLTIDECLAIQTFPRDYKLHGSRSAQYRQIGNAVPPKLAYAVAEVVSSILKTALLEQFQTAAE